MIRRGFWVMTGAVTGIYGYRRVSAFGRRVSGRLTPAGTADLARETFRFTRDVREGMELYRLRRSAPAGSTLAKDHPLAQDYPLAQDHPLTQDHEARPEDGR